jgi:hypothetical protein
MGDFQGHPFRGNQYAVGQSVTHAQRGVSGVIKHGPVNVFTANTDAGELLYEVNWNNGTTSRPKGKDLVALLVRPSIDQGVLSPNGRVSGVARAAALERARVELFGEKGLQRPEAAQPSKAEAASRELKQLHDLASRGMKSPGYRKRVKELEAVISGKG